MGRKRADESDGKAANKRRPIEERIAALMGKTAYRDIRDGFGGGDPRKLGDKAVAAALGFVSREQGRIAPMVLETYYGSTIMHLDVIHRAWESKEAPGPMPHEITVRMRMACEIAVRELSGLEFTRSHFEHLAYLGEVSRIALERRTNDAAAWLEGIKSAALASLRARLRNFRA